MNLADFGKLKRKFFSFEKGNLFSLSLKNYGFGPIEDPREYVLNTMAPFGMDRQQMGDILLVTIPKIMGYVFNPVSFWLCFNLERELSAVFVEVNNTFGERHGYVCAHPAFASIGSSDWFTSDKVFHVSPFCQTIGKYDFRFDVNAETVNININYSTEEGKTISTSIASKREPFTDKNLFKYFCRYPLMTLRIMVLIHYHALRLWLKKVPYYSKPIKPDANVT